MEFYEDLAFRLANLKYRGWNDTGVYRDLLEFQDALFNSIVLLQKL